MEHRWTEERMDRLYLRALAILDRKANGHAWPILHALCRRKHAGACDLLTSFLTDPFAATAGERRRGMAMARANVRTDSPSGMYNLAIQYRNQGDLHRYRYWLARAVKRGKDPYDIRELRFFETRFPHEVMRRFGRIRPYRKRDNWQCA